MARSQEPRSSAGSTQLIAAAPRAVKSEETNPSGDKRQRPVPTKGWPALWYNIKMRFVDNPIPPKLSKKERAEVGEAAARQAADEEQARRETLRSVGVETLRQLSDEVSSGTVVFLGVKGAAATTTTAAHAASVAADLSRSTLVFTDLNPASGTGAARLGKDYDETATLREVIGDLERFENFKGFIRRIRPTRYSVRPISANDIVSDVQHLDRDRAESLLSTVSINCEYHFIDTANDITDPVILAAIAAADVLVFTAYVGIHDSLRQLGIGMQTVRKHGFEDKVDASVVVISGLTEEQDLRDYRKYLNRVSLSSQQVIEEYPYDGPFMSVPYDEVIRRDTVVDLEALDWETYQAYLDLVIVIFEQARQAERKRRHEVRQSNLSEPDASSEEL